jgi:hypothetical protein
VPFRYQFAALDNDSPMQHLVYALAAGAPVGATLSPDGLFRWTPSEQQGPGAYLCKIQISDDGDPPMSAEQTLTLNVREVNTAPLLYAPSDQQIEVGKTLSITLQALDPDEPANRLTFSVLDGPVNATLDGSSGQFLWTPTAAGTNMVTI